MEKIILYTDVDATKPLHVTPIIIDFDWAYELSEGFGYSLFGMFDFGL